MSAIAARFPIASVAGKQWERIYTSTQEQSNTMGFQVFTTSFESPVAIFPKSPYPTMAISLRTLAGASIHFGIESGYISFRKSRKWLTIGFRHLISLLGISCLEPESAQTLLGLELFYPLIQSDLTIP